MKNNTLNCLRKTLFVVFFLSTAMLTYAQSTITGVVVDAANSEPIIGANVIVKGTTNGTITDFDGNFMLSVEKGATLEISYMGYKTVTVSATDGMKVELAEDSELLEEVVVVGYGVVKKNDKDYKNNGNIKWNFTKFLIDRNGAIVARFEPTNMKSLREAIKECL